MGMDKPRNSGRPVFAVDAAAAGQLAKVAGVAIPLDRWPDAAERFNEMLAFLAQLDWLDISEIAPAAVFDPSWEVSHGS